MQKYTSNDKVHTTIRHLNGILDLPQHHLVPRARICLVHIGSGAHRMDLVKLLIRDASKTQQTQKDAHKQQKVAVK